MACKAHTIFYLGCGHVFLAQDRESSDNENVSDSKDNKSAATQPESGFQFPHHTSPVQYPCNEYLPHTINVSSVSCNECETLPKAFQMHALGADPNDIEGFDAFCKEWIEQVNANVRMEKALRESAEKKAARKVTDLENGNEDTDPRDFEGNGQK